MGRDASVRFRDQIAARPDFGALAIDAAEKPMTRAALISLQEHVDPDIRRNARTLLLETFGANRQVFTSLYSSVVKNHGIEAERRSFAEPIEVENVSNEIPGGVVRNLLDVAKEYAPRFQEYYRWKQRPRTVWVRGLRVTRISSGQEA